ncbi:allene oxide synthase-lipoxygenase protein-like isoform X2 [Oculina patagonica]
MASYRGNECFECFYFIRRKLMGTQHVNIAGDEKMTSEYLITVITGIRKGAGTDASVSLVIKGTNGETNPLALDKWFHNDFEAGQKDEYHVTAKDVGELLMVTLRNDGGGLYSDWFVNRVTIKDKTKNATFDFPCNRWVQNESIIFEGKAKLPTDEQHSTVKSRREAELKERKALYEWGHDDVYSDLPGYVKASEVKDLPKDVQFTEEAAYDLHRARKQALINLGLVHLLNMFDRWDDFDDYRKAFTGFVGDVPQAAEYWKEDRFVGFQFLNGCNPDSLKRCTKLPPHFPVTQELVGNLLDSGDTLESAMADGRIYMVDYKILEDIPHYGQDQEDLERRYMCASLGLFYVKGNGDLVPIAIQFHQDPHHENPIWTPNDAEMDWICAKLWLRNSDTQFHQMITHLLRTHLFMEPIAVASYRQLPTLHPLWKLLSPHIRGVLAINTVGRERLIPAGGVADLTLTVGGGGHITLMKKYYKNSSTWASYNLPQVLKERGVDDAEKLPNFHYREDALKLWAAIEAFVKEIMSVYYHADDDVKKDHELQNWVRDLHDNGYPTMAGHTNHGVPTSFTSCDQLYDFLIAIIFTCACQHAAVNFSQMDVYGFPPNSPALMRQPPPKKKGIVGMADLMKCLATKHQSSLTIATVYDLTRIYSDEKFIGDYPEDLFIEEAAKSVISNFQKKLKGISAEIKARNAKLVVPYPYLLPERVPNGIAI